MKMNMKELKANLLSNLTMLEDDKDAIINTLLDTLPKETLEELVESSNRALEQMLP